MLLLGHNSFIFMQFLSNILLNITLVHLHWGWRPPPSTLENPGSTIDGYCLIFNPSELVTYIEWDPP